MLNMRNAYTQELDDVQLAVEEILQQLELDAFLLPHAAGLISCHPEFLETGVVEALCERLPFEVVGATSLGNAVNGELGLMQLCLSVFTSSDVEFITVLSEPLSDEDLSGVADAYTNVAGGLPRAPGLVLVMAPFIPGVGGERILQRLDEAAGGAPVFGTLASEPDIDMSLCATIHNGKTYDRSASLLLMVGEIHPRFFVASLSEDRVQKQRAVVTKSKGNLIMEINDVSVRAYMQSIGLSKGDGIEGVNAIPFVFDLNDGTKPATWAIYMVTEEGYAACGGAVPPNSTFAVGSLEMDDVLHTAEQVTLQALQAGSNGLLLFPCMGRNMVLGLDSLAEMEVVEKLAGGRIPYHLSYSNGEVCPVYTAAGGTANRFHNFTFIVCAL